ncbi:hypothetical protein NIBR502772_22000 [Pseudarthrobacter sp. NIBRBAC000502772]|uniref:DUF5343 domain-containing protein n=1 Tax=Pseudarthrobacter sp. NIBRBAC000502772 TaxID=2590775 RepID=UPI001131F25D|nr:DUF5343 domain-containing protein [Pseudarthrobacter sp. NIBRBAC000502772]QDG68523.1 hypothetical protein NIBR502772_22000 [Pseudarthrobacter sp. NIBRBAC000502772]
MTAESVEQKTAYPYMSPSVWTSLRRVFFKQVPSKVSLTYLSSILSITEKTAKNILPQMRNVGLIDQDGVPTDLAQDFRFEETYPKVCDTILESLYPLEVREIFPSPDADPAAVANWFMRHSKSGQASANVVAKFYLHLVAKEPLPEDVKPRTPRAAKQKSKPAAPAKSEPEKVTEKADIPAESFAPVQPQPNGHPHPVAQQHSGPSLHVDLQVHIDSSASADQIDAIFASMAKHLYGR